MKKLILLVVIVFSVSANSQYKVRTNSSDYLYADMFSIGGNISFSSESFESTEAKKTVLNFTPSFSYFILSRLSVGISGQFNNIAVANTNTTEWGIGPSLRYYFNVKRFAPFIGAAYSYGIQSFSQNDDEFKTTRYIISGGANYFIVRNVAFEFTLNYSFINEKYPDRFSSSLQSIESDSRMVALAMGINIFI